MPDPQPFYLAGVPTRSDRCASVVDKHTGEVFAHVSQADAGVVEDAIAAAVKATKPMRLLASYQRRDVLAHIASRLTERRADFAQTIRREAGKPVTAAQVEVDRAIETFRLAAEEATRLGGEQFPLDISPRSVGLMGITRRVPVGPCSFITPFNFPLNLVAHKVAPALAVGCPFVLKPAPQTPLCALMLAEILAECGLPAGAFSILPCSVEDAGALVTDERIKLLSFTGSAAVGWTLKSRAGKKKVVLELGGNAACIVDADAVDASVVPRLIFGAFYQSGQSCISVQRVLVHRRIYDSLRIELVAAASLLKRGDPNDPATLLGPMISESEADRIEHWVNQAVRDGATILCGGKRDGAFYVATIVEGVPRGAKLRTEEAFAPVMTLEPFDRFEDAIAEVNSSRYGLQAGVFTNSLHHAQMAFDELEVGGIVINDVPSTRVDSMPYGGVKDSGVGREGVRYAMGEMTELRTLVLKGT